MALTAENIGAVDRINARVRACLEECESLYHMEGTTDGDVNAMIAILYHQMQATKQISSQTLRVCRRAYAPGIDAAYAASSLSN